MIENAIVVAPPVPRRQTLEALHGMQRFMHSLRNAAQTCQLNHRYYGGRQAVRLLDFDIVSGAFRMLGLARMLDQAMPPDLHTQRFSESIQLALGPHSVRRVIGLATRGAFSLPIGTQYELVKRKQELNQALTQQGMAFLERLEVAQNSKNPIQTIAAHWSPTSNWLWDELSGIEPLYDELALLDEIKDRAIPIERVMELAEVDPASRAYKLALSELEQRRGNQRRSSNYCDAINVALLVGAFQESERKGGLVPILVTDTPSVVGLHSRQGELMLPKDRRIRVFNEYLDFVLSLAFERMTNGNNALVANHAGVFAHEASNTINAIQRVVDHVESTGALQGPEWKLLSNTWWRFHDEWREVLTPVVEGSRLDRTSFRNALHADASRELLIGLRKNPDQSRTALELLERSLRADATRERAALRLLAATSMDSHTRPPEIGTLFAVYVNIATDACGQLQSESALGQPFESVSSSPALDPPFRMAVAHRMIPETLLGLDVHNDEDVSLTWRYDLANADAAQAIAALLTALTDPKPSLSLEVQYFTDADTIAKHQTAGELEVGLRADIRAHEPHYVEVLSEDLAVLCDIEPLLNREHQLGFVCSRTRLLANDFRTWQRVGAVMSETSLVALDPSAFGSVLSEVVNCVRKAVQKENVSGE